MKTYRQGDVLIVAITSIPKDAKPSKDLVLAHGEVTGHKHQILNRKTVKKFVAERLQYLEVTRPKCFLTHEEHSAIEIPEGKYVVLIQQEYAPGELKAVRD